ncbi:MAG: hypothetical protein M0Z80_05190, partial [Treponema sp.]|nr:hypothetical protein [Treponema sp.]
TSMNVGYLTVPPGGASRVDWAWLASFPHATRSVHCVHTELPEALDILMDGRKGRALVRKRAGSEPSAAAPPASASAEDAYPDQPPE